MSINQITQADQITAANYGMTHFDGDAEVAEDLGISYSPENLAQQIRSGHAVLEMSAVDAPKPAPRVSSDWAVAHERNVRDYHLHDGPLHMPSPEEKARTTRANHAVKAQIVPTRHA